jgi:hypothetical protein
MSVRRLLCWVAIFAAVSVVNRAEAQVIYGGSVRYGRSVGFAAGPLGGSVVRVRGPLGGGVTVAQGPFGGGAVGVRGPFGGRVAVARPPIYPVVPVAPVVAVTPVVPVPVHVVQQTVLNPAPAPMPYSPTYFARIPPGFLTLSIGGVNYFYTPMLPPDSQPTTVGGAAYFVSNGVTYQPYFLGAQTVYLVVEL